MSENSKIEWCDHTFNPWRGCTMVSPGCAHCYAARDAVRFPNIRGIWGDKGTRIVAVPDAWKAPEKWNRLAASCGVESGAHTCPICAGPNGPHRPRVFCSSLADVFEDWKGDLRFPAEISPEGWVTARWDGFQLVREFGDSAAAQGLRKATMDDARTELFRLIEATPNLDWLLLTKRPANVMQMVPEHWRVEFPENVWIGTTVEDQQRANERIPELLQIPAKVRFLSCEPLLGPVDLEEVNYTVSPGYFGDSFGPSHLPGTRQQIDELPEYPKIHWVIVGGESGPGSRCISPEWVRSIRDQCKNNRTPFLFKQWGEYSYDLENPIPTKNAGAFCYDIERVGKKKSGRLLDGVEHNEFPTQEGSR